MTEKRICIKSRFGLFLLILCCCARSIIPDNAEASDIGHGVIKIYAGAPGDCEYEKCGLDPVGSGFIIFDNKILTNAHVVDTLPGIFVRKSNDAKKYRANTLFVTSEADLALLTVDDGRFFEGVLPLEFGELPDVGNEVSVYGFPGSEEIVIARGRYRGIGEERYLFGNSSFLAGHIHAEIRPGNSGSPVISNNKVAGIIMQATAHYDRGLMVPSYLIKHFLADISDGKSDDFH